MQKRIIIIDRKLRGWGRYVNLIYCNGTQAESADLLCIVPVFILFTKQAFLGGSWHAKNIKAHMR